MRSLLVHLSVRLFFWILVGLSLWLLYRGHHYPGGGFIAGLTLICAFLLKAVDEGIKAFRVLGLRVFALGLALAALSGLVALAESKPLLTGLWWGSFGTPLIFDLGVFLVVVGQMSLIFSIVLEIAGVES